MANRSGSVVKQSLTLLSDTFNRLHKSLRISVTDRCNLRCVYCMPEDATFLDSSALLNFDEITRFTRVAVGLGIDNVRLTGGEPLLRNDLSTLIRQLTVIPGLNDIGLTTNGLLLAQQARSLFDAGLRRLNVSLDTLDPARFQAIARRDGLALVLNGLQTAKRVGFTPIKVNAVALRDTLDDVVALARYCREDGFSLRFIESMPIGADPWQREQVVPAHELLELLDREVSPIVPAERYDPHAPALPFRYADGLGDVGVIASVTRPFCKQCDRLRLTADGKLRNCLFALEEFDVTEPLRRHDEVGVETIIRECVAAKWEGHRFNADDYVKPNRTMHAIGG